MLKMCQNIAEIVFEASMKHKRWKWLDQRVMVEKLRVNRVIFDKILGSKK